SRLTWWPASASSSPSSSAPPVSGATRSTPTSRASPASLTPTHAPSTPSPFREPAPLRGGNPVRPGSGGHFLDVDDAGLAGHGHARGHDARVVHLALRPLEPQEHGVVHV